MKFLYNIPKFFKQRDLLYLKCKFFCREICETTCKFIKYKSYQRISQSDYVAIMDVGAYGSSLSSNYNTKPYIAELIVAKNKVNFIRRKQDLYKLINN